MPIYSELAKDADFKIPMRSAASRPEYDEDTEVDVEEPSSSTGARRVSLGDNSFHYRVLSMI